MRDHCKDTKDFLMHVHECMVYFFFLASIEKKNQYFSKKLLCMTLDWRLFKGNNSVTAFQRK